MCVCDRVSESERELVCEILLVHDITVIGQNGVFFGGRQLCRTKHRGGGVRRKNHENV